MEYYSALKMSAILTAKEKMILTFAKMVKSTFSRLLQLVSRLSQWGRERGLNSRYDKVGWGFTTNKQSEGVSGWEIPKKRCYG